MNKILLFLLGFLPLFLVAQPSRNMSQADSYVLTGSEYLLNQSFPAALSAFDKAIQLDRNHWCAYHFRATVLTIMEQYQPALDDLNDAIRLNSRNPVLFYKRGSILEMMGEVREAALDFQRALELAPEYPEASKKLSRLVGSRNGVGSREVTRGGTYYESPNYEYKSSRAIALEREYGIPPATQYDLYEDRPEYTTARTLRTERENSSNMPALRSSDQEYYPDYDRQDDFTRTDKYRRTDGNRLSYNSSSNSSSPSSWQEAATRGVNSPNDKPVMSQRDADERAESFFDTEKDIYYDEPDARSDIASATIPIEEKDSFDPYDGAPKKPKPTSTTPVMRSGGTSSGTTKSEQETNGNTFDISGDRTSEDDSKNIFNSRTITLPNASNKPGSDLEEQALASPQGRREEIYYIAKQASPGNKSVYIENVVSTPAYTQIDFMVNGDDETITLPPPRVKLQVEGKVYHLYYGQNTQPKTYQLKNGFPEKFSIKFQPIPENTEFIKVVSEGAKSGERWNYVFKLIEK